MTDAAQRRPLRCRHGLDTSGECKACLDNLRRAICHGIWRWGNRMILGLTGYDTQQAGNYTGAQWRVINNRGKRARYKALRGRGLSSIAAKARLNGRSIQREQELQDLSHQRQKERGQPYRVGSLAWVEGQVPRVKIL